MVMMVQGLAVSHTYHVSIFYLLLLLLSNMANCMGRRLCQNSNLGRRTKGIDIYRSDRYLSAVFLTDLCLLVIDIY